MPLGHVHYWQGDPVLHCGQGVKGMHCRVTTTTTTHSPQHLVLLTCSGNTPLDRTVDG